mgnify:CR=1 FL=1
MASRASFQQFTATFFEECHELISDTEQHLTQLKDGTGDSETLNAVFRAVHSIKAGAGALDFGQLVEFTHIFEATLEKLRSNVKTCEAPVIDVLFQAFDILVDLVRAAEHGETLCPDVTREAQNLLLAIFGEAPRTDAAHHSAPASQSGLATYAIRFEPRADLFRSANEPILIFRALSALGTLAIELNTDALPPLEALDPEDSYFKWRLQLETEAPLEDIQEAFEFVADDCLLEIEKLDGEQPEFEQPAEAVEEVAEGLARAVDADAAKAGSRLSSIRVELDRIDRLVNMVGELVITQSMLTQEIQELDTRQNSRLISGMEVLAAHARELQDNVMSIRMQPVKSVFSRMPRVVRDLSKQLGKRVRLISEGETTEVDKTVIEEIVDPLTHMIRNSLDHGIEPPEERIAAGKPAEGTIWLRAEHRGGRILIEIEDDGRGIDADKVLARAIEKGLVDADARPSQDEIINLIFHPGFSTAAQVTSVSGRGVGMDVVRRNVQALGGRISVSTNLGAGSRFTLALPLTLAVLDGMIVRVGAQKYVVPVNSIVESIQPRKADIRALMGGSQLLNIRGRFVPLIHVASAFGAADARIEPWSGLAVVVDTESGQQIGLVVDELLGQQQVVIKSLEANYRHIEGVSAATILGNGQVCLIVDVDGLEAIERRTRGQDLQGGHHAAPADAPPLDAAIVC